MSWSSECIFLSFSLSLAAREIYNIRFSTRLVRYLQFMKIAAGEERDNGDDGMSVCVCVWCVFGSIAMRDDKNRTETKSEMRSHNNERNDAER